MNRRELLKWTTPVIVAVTLPAHAQMSEPDVPEDPPMDPPVEPPVDDNPENFNCEVPTSDRPNLPRIRNRCGARGGKAASLNTRMGAFSQPRGSRPARIDRACEARRNYEFCGFERIDPETRVCRDLRRSFDTFGNQYEILRNVCE